jgi:hypothetical protein
MALIGAVYKWRLDCDSYVYITDYNDVEPLIITGGCLEENSEQNIKDIVTTWDEHTYCERFNEMINYVHSFEKWRDLLFLDCNVYLKEYYSCEEMLAPAFPTGIELNLSATSVEYYAQPEANVLDVKCITRDGEKITSYDINFGIPGGIPGLTIKGSWTPSSSFIKPEISELNHGYFIMKDAESGEFPESSTRGDLYVCTKRGYLTETGELVQAEFQNVGNLLGPPVLIYAKEGVNIDKVGKPTVTVSSNDSGSEYTFTFDYLKGEHGEAGETDISGLMLKDGGNYVGDMSLPPQTLQAAWIVNDSKGEFKNSSSASTLTVEVGAIVDYTGKWKYNTPNSEQKSPKLFKGDFTTSDVGSNTIVTHEWKNITKDSTKKTFSQTIGAPKSGLIVSNNKVIRAYGNDENTVTNSVDFLNRIYYGLSTNPNISDLNGFKSLSPIKIGSANSNTLLITNLAASYNMTVDCSGGKYIYFIYPSSLGSLTWYIGGFDSTALIEETTKTITNDYGYSVSYKICRTPKQTGNPMNVVISKK